MSYLVSDEDNIYKIYKQKSNLLHKNSEQPEQTNDAFTHNNNTCFSYKHKQTRHLLPASCLSACLPIQCTIIFPSFPSAASGVVIVSQLPLFLLLTHESLHLLATLLPLEDLYFLLIIPLTTTLLLTPRKTTLFSTHTLTLTGGGGGGIEVRRVRGELSRSRG